MIVPNADLKFAHETLRSFMDAVALTRAIATLDHPPYSLRVARNAAFDVAVIGWCILFGSDHADHQPIHWKNMFNVDRFRDGLVAALGVSLDEWRAYRKGVVDYRNELAAHRDLSPDTTHHPNLDAALAAADFYYERLRERFAAEMGAKVDGGTLMEEFKDRLDVFTRDMAKALDGMKA